MKSILAVLFVVVCLVVPAMAQETEVTGSFAWQDNDTARTYSAGFNLDFPVTDGGALMFGPAFGSTYLKPDKGSSVTAHDFGGRVTLNLMGRDGLFVAATALYHEGDTTGKYSIAPEVGLKFGGDGAFVRVSLAMPYQLDDEKEDLIDLETLQGTVAIGLRF